MKRLALGLAFIFTALPGLAQDNFPLMIGSVDDPDKIASCALAVDASKRYATPIVTLMTPNTAYVSVTFGYFDASGRSLGSQGVTVPPPLPTDLPLQLTQLDVPEGLASTRCSITGRAATVAANQRGGALLAGLLLVGAAGAIVDVVSNSNAKATPVRLGNGTPTPVSSTSPVASASAASSASPAPTHTPAPSPSPTPTAAPSPTSRPRGR